MRILLSNDDGYRAPGLLCLWRTLSNRWEVTVAAPDRDRSGASNSLTLRNPLRAERRENGFIVIEGTPTDCVHLALTGLLDTEPDLVVSGINAGGNLGDDVLYSGTVAAALEGRHLGLPAIAVSLVGRDPHRYETAARGGGKAPWGALPWLHPAGNGPQRERPGPAPGPDRRGEGDAARSPAPLPSSGPRPRSGRRVHLLVR